MRFRLGFVAGAATGYYLGARAGRQRYEQINRVLRKLRRSKQFEAVSDKTRSAIDHAVESVVEKGKEKAESLVHRDSNAAAPSNGTAAATANTLPNGPAVPPAQPIAGCPTGLPEPPYSSSK
jgi:hypothetical protein